MDLHRNVACFAPLNHYKCDEIHFFTKYPTYEFIKDVPEMIGISYNELVLWYLEKMEHLGCKFVPVIPNIEDDSQIARLTACVSSGFRIINEFGMPHILMKATIIRYIQEYPNMLVAWYKLLQLYPDLALSDARTYSSFGIANAGGNPLGLDFKGQNQICNPGHTLFANACNTVYKLPSFQAALSGKRKIGVRALDIATAVDSQFFPNRPYGSSMTPLIEWIINNVE